MTLSRELVSIVVPCYNYGHFLSEALQSACDQTYSPVEILVVDDGSTDATPDVVGSFENRVRYLHQDNGGLARARNAGASASRGELLVFLDPDDRLAADYVEKCVAALTPEFAFVYTQARFFGDGEGVTERPGFSVQELKRGNFIHASALLRTAVVREHPYDPGLGAGWEDWDFYLTLAEQGYEGFLVDEPLLHYRRHAASMTAALNRNPARKRRLQAAVLRRHARLFGWKRVIACQIEALRATVMWGLRAAASPASAGSPGGRSKEEE